MIETTPELAARVLRTPLDSEWVDQRIEDLRPVADGSARLIPKEIWNLASALMQRDDTWLEIWKHFALRCPRDWLVRFCGVAMLKSPQRKKKRGSDTRPEAERPLRLRSLDSIRARTMLAMGIIVWHLAEYDPSGDETGGHCPWVVRGLPCSAFQHLLAYWEKHADGTRLRTPSYSTLFGTHEKDGRADYGELGYFPSWKQVGIARTVQPPGWHMPKWLRGNVRKDKHGNKVCFAFVQLRLRIPSPKGEQPMPMGPPPPQPRGRGRPRPPLDVTPEELDEIDENLWRQTEALRATQAQAADSATSSQRAEVVPEVGRQAVGPVKEAPRTAPKDAQAGLEFVKNLVRWSAKEAAAPEPTPAPGRSALEAAAAVADSAAGAAAAALDALRQRAGNKPSPDVLPQVPVSEATWRSRQQQHEEDPAFLEVLRQQEEEQRGREEDRQLERERQRKPPE